VLPRLGSLGLVPPTPAALAFLPRSGPLGLCAPAEAEALAELLPGLTFLVLVELMAANKEALWRKESAPEP
jgi:hypothetical protein